MDLMTFNWTTTVYHSMEEWSWLWVLVNTMYLPTIFCIQHLKIKENIYCVRFIRYLWVLWNGSLALFSMFGSYYTFYGVKSILINGDCQWNQGNLAWLNNEPGKWVYYLILSKMVELGDTVFLAILGKPIPFLHWYHHLLTSSMCILHLNNIKPWYVVGTFINYSIHSVMYIYYMCSAAGYYWNRKWAQRITFIQTSQMVAMTGYYTYVWWRGNECYTYLLPTSVIGYMIYLVLFAYYYIERYLNK